MAAPWMQSARRLLSGDPSLAVAADQIQDPVATTAEAAAPKIRRRSIYNDAPASVLEIVQFTRSGSWVPGLQADWLENLGKLYGYVIAVPVSLLLYSLAWLVQRPGRLLLALLLGAVVWYSG